MGELTLEDLFRKEEAPPEPLVQSIRFKEISLLVRETIPLAEADLQVLAVRGPEHSQTQIKHIRAYHHLVALRLALGEKQTQISAALGLTPQTITKLQASPQFAELVETYRGRLVDKAIDHVELMSAVSAEALMALHEKLTSDEREDLPIETLRRLAETFVDRIGHSPVRRSESTNVHRIALDSGAIARIKALHGEERRWDQKADFIDASFSSHDEAAQSLGSSGGALVVFKSPSKEVKAVPDDGSGERV